MRLVPGIRRLWPALIFVALILLILASLIWDVVPVGGGDGTRVALGATIPVEGEKNSAHVATASHPTSMSAEKGLSPEDARLLAQMREQSFRERSLFEVLQQRERDLDARERRIDKEAEQLLFLRASLEEKIAELKALQSEVEELLTRAESQKKREVKNLIGVYQSMKPQQAAEILQKMDEPMALQILGGMPPETISKVLGSMEQEKAALLSKRLVSSPSEK